MLVILPRELAYEGRWVVFRGAFTGLSCSRIVELLRPLPPTGARLVQKSVVYRSISRSEDLLRGVF